jgi:cysteine desulfurase/selenocysteine lyase
MYVSDTMSGLPEQPPREVVSDGLASRISGDFPILRQAASGTRLVYLDSAATSQKPQVVIDALVDFYSSYNANIHRALYDIAERATNAFESARTKVAMFIGAQPEEVIWTRNTTEAINLVAFSWGAANIGPGDVVLTTELEHHSNLVPWQLLAQRTGAELRFIPVDDRGLHILDSLDDLLQDCKLVALAHVSNALGTIAPLQTIIARAHAKGAVVLVDGAQAAPHLPIDMRTLNADFYTFSAHKMCGPTGIGVLYGKREILLTMDPFLTGGDMIRKVTYEKSSFNDLPWKFEAGTSNIADAIAFGAAIDYLQHIGMEQVRQHERSLMAYALEQLSTLEPRGLKIYGPRDPEMASGVISFNFADVHPHDVASLLNGESICVRAGHHCTMPLMKKTGWSATTRASFYLYNDARDIDALVQGLHKIAGVFNL